MYTVSIRNNLDVAVKDVYLLAVFYDSEGQPVDFTIRQYEDVIPPRLAKRVRGSTDSSVREIITVYGRDVGSVEFRVLDFSIVE